MEGSKKRKTTEENDKGKRLRKENTGSESPDGDDAGSESPDADDNGSGPSDDDTGSDSSAETDGDPEDWCPVYAKYIAKDELFLVSVVNKNDPLDIKQIVEDEAVSYLKAMFGKKDPNIMVLFNRESYLHDACQENDIDCVEILLDMGADANKSNEIGEPPLHLAESEEVRDLLLKHEADIDSVDGDEQTVLHKACRDGDEETVKCLLDHSADVNCRNSEGDTPLHLAYEKGHAEICSILTEHGADPNIENKNGVTPYHMKHE